MALAIDGNNTASQAAFTAAPSLTTANTNDYIIACVYYQAASLTSVIGSTLGNFGSPIASWTGGGGNVAIFALFSSGALTAETITATQSQNFLITVDVFGVSGSNQTGLVFDAGGPVTAGSSPQNFTTANANTMLISAMAWFIANPGPGTGFTQIPSSGVGALMSQYQVLSSAGLVSVGSGNDGLVNGFAAIAIVQAAAGGDTLAPQQTFFM